MTYALRLVELSGPVAYKELAARLGVELGARVPLDQVVEAVLELRRGKGMVLDPADPDTRSAGSFFTNPVLGRRGGGPGARAPGHPRWDMPDGMVKIPAAWLIEQAGTPRATKGAGPHLDQAHAGSHQPHRRAAAADLLALAREVRDGVQEKFGVWLVNEPVLVG